MGLSIPIVADPAHHLGGKAGAGAAVAAPAILAAIGLVPEEGVEQIAMGAVDRDAVEAERHRLAGRARIALGDFVERGLAARRGKLRLGRDHPRIDRGLTPERPPKPGWADRWRLGMATRSRLAQDSLVPKLRKDRDALGMDRLDHRPPAGKRGVMAQLGQVAFGDDQLNAALGAARIVSRDIATGNAARAAVARHRRHHDAIAQHQPAKRQRLEQRAAILEAIRHAIAEGQSGGIRADSWAIASALKV